MNKLQLTAVAFVTAIATLTVAPSALAIEQGYTCENGFTGPDSKNLCISVTEYTCEIENDNNVVIVNENTQVAVSGDGEGDDSNDSGNVQTGSITNDNGVTFNVTVENGEVCSVVATKPAIPPVVPEAPKTPETPKVTAPQAEKPAVLAKTSGNEVFVYAIGAAASIAAAAVIARFAVLAYSRLKN